MLGSLCLDDSWHTCGTPLRHFCRYFCRYFCPPSPTLPRRTSNTLPLHPTSPLAAPPHLTRFAFWPAAAHSLGHPPRPPAPSPNSAPLRLPLLSSRPIVLLRKWCMRALNSFLLSFVPFFFSTVLSTLKSAARVTQRAESISTAAPRAKDNHKSFLELVDSTP